jgi:aromatase
MAAHTDNSIVIDAPLDVVWRITNDIENWPNLFTEYAKAEILEQVDDHTVNFRLTMHPDGQGNQWSWISQRSWDEATHTTKSHRIETGWFEYMHINWYYEPIDGGTNMRWVQDFTMKPDAPFKDEQMEANMNKSTKVQMQVIKERVEAQAAQG